MAARFTRPAGGRAERREYSTDQNGTAVGQLTTHVLDTSVGLPAAGVRIEVHRVDGAAVDLLAERITQENGRCAAPLLEASQLRAGRYRLTVHLGAYFASRGVELSDPPFLEQAVVQIGIADPQQHYHVPLLITPWSYSVYRGG
jgi:5-hydroxyisourate hydrolase